MGAVLPVLGLTTLPQAVAAEAVWPTPQTSISCLPSIRSLLDQEVVHLLAALIQPVIRRIMAAQQRFLRHPRGNP